jgi:hypothetical protein
MIRKTEKPNWNKNNKQLNKQNKKNVPALDKVLWKWENDSEKYTYKMKYHGYTN